MNINIQDLLEGAIRMAIKRYGTFPIEIHLSEDPYTRLVNHIKELTGQDNSKLDSFVWNCIIVKRRVSNAIYGIFFLYAQDYRDLSAQYPSTLKVKEGD